MAISKQRFSSPAPDFGFLTRRYLICPFFLVAASIYHQFSFPSCLLTLSISIFQLLLLRISAELFPTTTLIKQCPNSPSSFFRSWLRPLVHLLLSLLARHSCHPLPRSPWPKTCLGKVNTHHPRYLDLSCPKCHQAFWECFPLSLQEHVHIRLLSLECFSKNLGPWLPAHGSSGIMSSDPSVDHLRGELMLHRGFNARMECKANSVCCFIGVFSLMEGLKKDYYKI